MEQNTASRVAVDEARVPNRYSAPGLREDTMTWLPSGPAFVFAPRDANFRRFSRRNEGGEQGLVGRIAIEPGDPTTVYAVLRPTSGGVGVYRSSGAGAATEDWTSITDVLQQGNPQIDPSCVAIDPVTPSTIYMGSWNDGSVYMSTTRGASWAPPVYVGARIRKLVIDPRTAGNANSTVIYAATDGGVFRSANSGQSWTNVLSGDVWSFCASMPPGGPDAYYAGVLRSGVFTTANPTGAWTNLNAGGIGLPAYNPSAAGGENFNVVYADLCPLNPSRVYVLLLSGGGGNFSAIYTSGAPTNAWSQVAVAAAHPDTAYGFYPFFGVYDFAFAVAPNSPGDGQTDILFFGGLIFWRSIDGGRTWQSPPTFLHADHHEIVFFPSAPPAGTIPNVYFGCDGGLAVSDRFCDPIVDITATLPDNDELNSYVDTGEVQNYDHGIRSVATYAYTSHPSFPALQYTAAQDTGVAGGVKTHVWRSLADADATQIAAAPGSDGMKVWFDLGQYQGWPSYRIIMATDQGQYGAGNATVTYPASGTPVAATSQLTVTPAGKCLLGLQTLDTNTNPGPNNPIRQTVGLIDQNASASRISQDFGAIGVSVVCVASFGQDTGYCATGDNRVWTTPSISAATAATIWTEVATGRPATIQISSLAMDAASNVYVLASSPITVGTVSSPLFSVGTGTWVIQPGTGVPNGPFGKMLADPVQTGVLYAASGSRIYKATLSAGSWSWQDISDNLPGQPIYDMWIANVGTSGSPKVLLRVTIPTRGVWELDVTATANPTPINLYLRDNFLDQGLLPTSPDFTSSPYAPTDPSQAAVHWMCADIKVDAQQVPGGANPNFYQTDPEGGVIPISPIAFGSMNDNSENLPSTDAARVHVQVNNASLIPAQNVVVWAIYASAAGHVPSLAKSASYGNAFPFWSQFGIANGVATITPNLPADSPWQSIGAPIVLSGIDAAHSKAASWNWVVPTLSSGDPGHYCIAAFVHSADNPITETAFDIDIITPRNRGIGQKNLHIGPPLPAVPKPRKFPLPQMREYIEFNNPYFEEMEFDLVFDFQSLPTQLEVRLQFTEMHTVQPLKKALIGIASEKTGNLVKRPHREEPKPDRDDKREKHRHGRRLEVKLPRFVNKVFLAEPSTRVSVNRVRVAPHSRVGAFFTVANTGELPEGGTYRFVVKQLGQNGVTGGSTYVVRIAGTARQERRLVAPSHDYELFVRTKKTIADSDPTSLPRWIRYVINTQRRNIDSNVIG